MGASDHGRRIKVAFGLFQPTRRKPQPDRRAIRLLHVVESMAQQNGQFIGMGGFVGNQPILRHAKQGRIDALVLAAFGCQRQAGRR